MDAIGDNRREGLGRRTVSRASLYVFLIASLIMLLFSLYSADASVFRKARESVLDGARPFLSLFAAPISAVQSTLGDISDYLNVIEENRALRAENAELRQWMEEALALRELMAIYEGLDQFKSAPGALPIDAFVIGDSNEAFAKSMVVNAGRGDEVARDQAVVSERGLVGRIIDVGQSASRVLLLTDIQSRIPVYVDGQAFGGILVGQTRARPIIRFSSEVEAAPVAVGARVLTSGAGGIIPRGLPVGTVSAVGDQEISVSLYADYAQTRLVRILKYTFPTLEGDEIAPGEDEGTPLSPDGQTSGSEIAGANEAAAQTLIRAEGPVRG